MGFCKQCGTDLQEAKFCPNCGTAVEGEVVVVQQGTVTSTMGTDIRQNNLMIMRQVIDYFSAKGNLYEELDVVSAEVEERKNKSSIIWMILGIACLLFGIIGGISLLMIAVGVILIVRYFKLKKDNQAKLQAAEERQENLLNEIYTYYEAYDNCPVGLEYTRPSILCAINDLLRAGRANTVSDAINLYLDDIHKANMENLAVETMKAAQETAESSAQAAKSAKKAAGYSSASFWLKR